MNRRVHIFALCLSLLSGAAILIFHTDTPQPALQPDEIQPMPTEISLSYVSRTNNTTDVLRMRLETTLSHATGRVFIEDPSETPAKTLRVVNLTAEGSRDVQLRTLPALFRVRGVVDLPGAPVLTKWVWQGHAHVSIADTPNGLAEALAGGQN